ncbi:MAG: argininosuccinate lyase [Candidatus Roseilinea sp.]|nr:MAG: argininosuccinate lyase [Candidatus Roseilinea sp.]
MMGRRNDTTATARLWGGRFSGETDALMKRFNDSIGFDIRLWDADIRGSIAYADALARAGVITEAEAATLVRGLRAVHEEFAQGRFAVKPGDEDIHTAVERRLRELVGEVAGKLHTGRSRNDQVATDLRLFCLDAIRNTQYAICDLQLALLSQAQAHVRTLMPGYTHLQRAQPITFAHWCLSYFWQFARDTERLDDCARRTAVSPLGSGALAGNPFAIDREALAAAIGFTPRGRGGAEDKTSASASLPLRGQITRNSLDGVSDRDFVAELLFCCAMIGVHLSRLAEDLIVYATAEFGFVTFDDAYATGSSLMPQKKNPDAMELARGKSGRLIGNLTAVLTMLKGLPMSYNKDLQEDKEPLFDSLDTLTLALPVAAGAIRTLRVNADRMRAALDPAMLATDVAEYLVRKGVPFREAHHLSGRAVALAESKGMSLRELEIGDWRSISPHFDEDVAHVFDFARSVASRDVAGGTSPRVLREQIKQAKRWLNARRKTQDARRKTQDARRKT